MRFDGRQFLDGFDDAVQEATCNFLMGNLPASKHDGDFDFVTRGQKTPRVRDLEVKVMRIRLRTHFDFLELGRGRVALGFRGFLLLLVLELAKVHDPANRRKCRGSHLDQVEALILCLADSVQRIHDAQLLSILIHHADLFGSNTMIDTGSLLRFRTGSWTLSQNNLLDMWPERLASDRLVAIFFALHLFAR